MYVCMYYLYMYNIIIVVNRNGVFMGIYIYLIIMNNYIYYIHIVYNDYLHKDWWDHHLNQIEYPCSHRKSSWNLSAPKLTLPRLRHMSKTTETPYFLGLKNRSFLLEDPSFLQESPSTNTFFHETPRKSQRLHSGSPLQVFFWDDPMWKRILLWEPLPFPPRRHKNK